MSHEFGGRRPPEAWVSPHDRARVRLAERMVEPLDPAEATWLEGHLLDCPSCREVDAAYLSEREGLRAMRVIPPPRDLWARTSAALDAEASRSWRRRPSGAAQRTATPTGTWRSTGSRQHRGIWTPLGAVSAIAAVMLVGFLLGNALITGPVAPSQVAIGTSHATSPGLLPTPTRGTQKDVAWVSADQNGLIVVHQAPVSTVCPTNDPAGCAPIDTGAQNVVTLSVKPKSVHVSPTSGQLIVIGQGSGQAGLSMYVVNVGMTGPTASPDTSSPSVGPTAPPTASPTRATPSPSGGTSPSASPGGPSPSPSVAVTSNPPSSATPTPTASSTAPAKPTPSPTSTIIPNVTPPPSAATLIAIASGIAVLSAETAAYSSDGVWFAFTARPIKDPSGSDIYLWHAGDAQATKVTDDHRSVFAGWVGDTLIGSRADPPVAASDTSASPSASPSASAPESAPASAPASVPASVSASTSASPSAGASTDASTAPATRAESTTTSFLVDPTTLAQTALATSAWRPSVDPTHRFVVYWDGTVAVDPLNGGWRTATGRLVIASWPLVAGPAAGPGPGSSGQPSPSEPPSSGPSGPSGSPAASPSSSPSSPATSAAGSTAAGASAAASDAGSTGPSPSPSAALPIALPDDIASAAGVDWAVAWDEAGTHLAIWIGDRSDRSFGHLDLIGIDQTTGSPNVTGPRLQARPALPGFSLADGHLAWATPPGQNGDGSSLQVYAYAGTDVGTISTKPQTGSDPVIVVQH